jgi:hypothetical protein
MLKTQKVRDYIAANPNLAASLVADKFGLSKAYVYVLRNQMRKQGTLSALSDKQTKPEVKAKRPVGRPRKFKATVVVPPEIIAITAPGTSSADMVNHPPHYKTGGIETIDFIEAKQLGYNLGNVVKYISRADHKGNRKENLEKARWYLDRELSRCE